jgi:DNA primase
VSSPKLTELKATDDKRVVRGLRSGVFEPFQVDVRGSELLVCEGASDVAAALSVGLEAIGRFSCSGTIEETVDRIRRHQPGRVIVVPDNDEPGLRGAEQLIRRLDGIARVELRRPPHGIKDLRAWTQAGATAGDIRKGAAS